MVFEQMFKIRWIERKENAFFLGLIYGILGIVSASIVFPSDVGLMSLAFCSALMVPSLTVLLRLEENVEVRENKLSIVQLFKDHKEIIKIYLFLFLGVFFAYGCITLIVALLRPETAYTLFHAQFEAVGFTGQATGAITLQSLWRNNVLVFLACFVLSMVYGAGAIVFLSWNASVWGVIFAYFLRNWILGAGVLAGLQAIVPSMPHLVFEALAYVVAAIAGGVLSTGFIREKFLSAKFIHITTDACLILLFGIIVVLVAGYIEILVIA